MTDRRIDDIEMADIIMSCAGVRVDAKTLSDQPQISFVTLGVDSLGVLGIVAELERRFGVSLAVDADEFLTPRELIELVDAQIRSEV